MITVSRDYEEYLVMMGLYAQTLDTATSSLESYLSVVRRFFKSAFRYYDPSDVELRIEIAPEYQKLFLDDVMALSKTHSLHTLKRNRSALSFLWHTLMHFDDGASPDQEQSGVSPKRVKRGLMELEYLSANYRFDLDDINVEVLSDEDEAKLRAHLLRSSKKSTKTFVEVRNALMVKLALMSGARLEEIRGVRFSYIEKKRSTYAVILRRGSEGARQKKRVVHLYHYMIHEEVEWLREHHKGDEIFVTKTMRPLANVEFKKALLSVLKGADIETAKYHRLGLGLLRHTYAVNLVLKGKKVETVRRKLGLVESKAARAYFIYAADGEIADM